LSSAQIWDTRQRTKIHLINRPIGPPERPALLFPSAPPSQPRSTGAQRRRPPRRARTVAAGLLFPPFLSPAKLLCWFRRNSWRGTSAGSASGTRAGGSFLPPPGSTLPRPDLLLCLPCGAPLRGLRRGGGSTGGERLHHPCPLRAFEPKRVGGGALRLSPASGAAARSTAHFGPCGAGNG